MCLFSLSGGEEGNRTPDLACPLQALKLGETIITSPYLPSSAMKSSNSRSPLIRIAATPIDNNKITSCNNSFGKS